MIECTNCKNDFIPSKPERKFCSWECYLDSKKRPSYVCHVCDKVFTPNRKPKNLDKPACSRRCSGIAGRKEILLNCDNCGKSIKRRPSELVGKDNFYCSRGCAFMGYSERYKGPNSPRYNPELSDEERVRNRKYPEYLSWRARVYERDFYTCQKCLDDTGGNLVAHHIYNFSEYPELRTVDSNGITLCESCHKEFHDTYGYTKNDREQLNHFMADNTERSLLETGGTCND